MNLKRVDLAGYSLELVAIPKGEIRLNDDRIQKQWTVSLHPFWLGKYPITQAAFQQVMGYHKSAFSHPEKPVDSLTWIEAVSFCNQLSALWGVSPCYRISSDQTKVQADLSQPGFRLPTEAEWQYACQAQTHDIRYGPLDEIAWYKDNSGHQSQVVGQKAPNPWGLHDMLGNVWEWCSDVYDEEIYGSYRVFRGGGWCDEARSVMATTRRRSHPTKFQIDDLGFRVAQNRD